VSLSGAPLPSDLNCCQLQGDVRYLVAQLIRAKTFKLRGGRVNMLAAYIIFSVNRFPSL
jgi:hypothetical protein